MTSFFQPRKQILTAEQLAFFQTSATNQTIISFIEQLNESVVGTRLTDEVEESEGVKAILDVLDKVEQIAKETPAVENAASRFGNPAFRTFYDRVSETSSALHSGILNLPSASIIEIATYFNEAWGNRSRIDYGSGMELNFLCWLICLHKLQVVHDSDARALVLRVFWRYIRVMRVLQSTYWLEPAGSHGVWGLDDYHFLPFLFGSAQLRGHKYIRPKAIHDAEVVEEYSKHYIYFACIQFINSIKTASLRWHSPMLDDISAVKTWDKVNSGMLKMYRAEVLDKLPVIQHFLFGSLLPWDGPILAPSEVALDPNDPHWGHSHAHPGPTTESASSDTHTTAATTTSITSPTSSSESQANGTTEKYPLPSEFPVPVRQRVPQPSNNDGDLGGAGQREVGWGDCCGIPVPSVFGAAQAEREKAELRDTNPNSISTATPNTPGVQRLPGAKLSGPGIRPVPFD